ncbi:uncharacterized protein LOC123313945 [Coccinella septempunctata]|uniref:uncharacterized protein LOC123313945 n=1 Tax=Coccinella septempunctata TaxID=41139 RepID=UPI001D091DD8|nr:uncharacterized protein LOC123313945 [Coccinella septempunctata]
MADIRFLRQLVGGPRRVYDYIKKGKLKGGQILTHTTEGNARIGEELIKEKSAVHLVGLDAGEDHKSEAYNVYEMCKKLKDHVNKPESIHLAIINNIERETKRKIIEGAFHDFKGQVILHEKLPLVRKDKKRGRKYDTEAVVIEKSSNTTYAQMVANLKNKFRREESVTKEIEGIRQTREGHLLLEIRKGSKETDTIFKKIKENMGGETIRKYRSGGAKIAANVYGLDIDVKEEEIKQALKESINISPNEGDIEIKAIRPMTGGRNAATVIAPPEVIERLLRKGKIKIDFSSVDVKERKPLTKCNRCWEEGHIGKDCRGEDRSGKCRNCGKDGHLVRDCTEKPFCLICLEDGHRTATNRCKEKRKTK